MIEEQHYVTPAMVKAGEDISSEMINATVCKILQEVGSTITWEQWLKEDIKNKDLILSYINDEIEPSTAIYIAMDRAKGE